MAFGAPAFPRQYVSSEITLHPFACSTYALDSAQSVCSVPALQCDHSQPHCHLGCRTEKPQNEHTCPLPREAKGVFKVRKCCGFQVSWHWSFDCLKCEKLVCCIIFKYCLPCCDNQPFLQAAWSLLSLNAWVVSTYCFALWKFLSQYGSSFLISYCCFEISVAEKTLWWEEDRWWAKVKQQTGRRCSAVWDESG